jgi:hypothetical protein
MRTFLIATTALALLAACTPPASQQERPDAPPAPDVIACNDVAPDASRQIGVEDAAAAATAVSDLRGGAITPGVYDLVRATRLGSATGWRGTRAVALAVSEDETGAVSFNWAGAAPGGEVDRWTATFTDTPQPRMTYTCGRAGEVPAEFAATATSLQLRLPDGANGRLAMDFERRS